MKLFANLRKKKGGTILAFELSIERTKAMFEKMEEAGWDMNGKMHWGYYFLDSNKDKLLSFLKRLELLGYESVERRKIEDNLCLLHVGEKEVYSPKSLYDNCKNLAKIASEYSIQTFYGWDVEKEILTKGLKN